MSRLPLLAVLKSAMKYFKEEVVQQGYLLLPEHEPGYRPDKDPDQDEDNDDNGMYPDLGNPEPFDEDCIDDDEDLDGNWE